MRTMNQRLLLDRLFTNGPATRPQLARDTGLSQPTVHAALADLEQAGLARAAGRPETGHGRPAQLYEADPSAGTVAAVDIGHDWLRLVVTDLASNQLSRIDVRNDARSARALVERVSAAVADAAAKASLPTTAITHTVIGSPGVFRPQQGSVAYAANLPGWQRPGLAEALTAQIGTPVTIDNDANLAALGEHSEGAGRGVTHFAYLHVGTGVGLGLILNGHIYRGFSGAAGEVGYIPLGEPPYDQARNPERGILEEALAADAVVAYARAAGMSDPLTAAAVFAAAREGVQPALTAVRREAERLAQLIAAVCAFLDPELIVIGGGVGQNLDMLESDLQTALQRITPLRARLAVGELGTDAVLRGAIATGVAIAREAVFTARLGS
ncbi:ROK family transcriptional regulator [Planosporangium flavigriseum]|nr:ROK family transcriptional regulator [Planosporangium flavigriseum]